MRKLLLILIFVTSMPKVFATILPDNDMAIPVSEKNEGLTESQYLQVISKVEAVYRPIVEAKGKILTIQKLWSDPTVNAGTIKNGDEIIIKLYGGYARHKLITEDAYALVICHELGHHLGGSPKKMIGGETGWPSVEGQADYFATLKCLRKVFRNDDNENIIRNLSVSSLVTKKCSQSFKENWEVAICIRTTAAGMAVGNISADMRNSDEPSVDTPDQTVVKKTFEDHPKPQCRLDTYFQGSLCEVSSARALSLDSELKGSCHPHLGHVQGTRPLCWFKPSI